jgi:hypothetical protein
MSSLPTRSAKSATCEKCNGHFATVQARATHRKSCNGTNKKKKKTEQVAPPPTPPATNPQTSPEPRNTRGFVGFSAELAPLVTHVKMVAISVNKRCAPESIDTPSLSEMNAAKDQLAYMRLVMALMDGHLKKMIENSREQIAAHLKLQNELASRALGKTPPPAKKQKTDTPMEQAK